MNKYIQFVNEFHEWNKAEIDFLNKQLVKHLLTNQENQTEIETILDFLFANKDKDLSKCWYKTILEKTEKWHKKLQSLSITDNEKVWEDYQIVKDFWDGFKFVKLISQNAYNREWKLMSHCVASYFWRNVNIYSLRDEKNLPHCTIEENQQVKWKWNWSIDPKYVDYIVKFLEHLGMRGWENEMKNLWYYKLDKIDQDLTSDSLYNWYISDNKLDTITDKEWETYYGFWLLNIKDLIIFKNDVKFSINLDIKNTVEYLIKSCKSILDIITWWNDKENQKISNKTDSAQIWSSWYSAQIWSSWNSAQIWSSWDSTQIWSSWDYAKIWSSWDYAKIWSSWYSAQIWNSWNYAQIWSSWNYAQIWSSWDSTQIWSSWNSAKIWSSWYSAQIWSSWNSAQIWSSWYSAQIWSSWDYAKIWSSWDYAQIWSSWYSAQIWSSWYSAQIWSSWNSAQIWSSWDSAQIWSSWDSTQIISEWQNAVIAWIWYNNQISAKIGSWITLAEYNSEWLCLCVKSQKIDWQILKEDTLYILKWWEFIEFN